MRLQLRAVSLFLTLASSILASSIVSSSTEGVAGAIVGALGAVDGQSADNGPVPLRRSITELAAEAGPQWDLYLQALRAMYDRDSKDPESFFQIAGIHGRPFTEYNNAGKMNTNGWGGYSTHGEILFIIWHRPFVALFEQTLVKEAKILAAQYPDNLRSIYQRAAEDLRAPYWDWALEPWLPSVVLPETIEVKAATKTGTVAKKIDNPLYTYRFSREVMQGKYGAFDTYDRMYRCQNPQDANQKLYSRNYKSWVYDVFSRAKSFSEFATTASKGSSIEGVHNAIHWDAGCGGQFLDSQYAAFEPVFMLHHSNVDRLWAYWQAIYPKASTFNGRYQGLSRFNTLSGTMIGLDSPLQPFRQANGEWHTSRSVNSIKTFGYAYQGLEYWTKSETEMQQGAPPAGIIIRPGTAADADAISQVHYEALDRFHAFYGTFFKKHPRELIPSMTRRAFVETRRPVQVFYVAVEEDDGEEGDVVGFVRFSIEEAKTEEKNEKKVIQEEEEEEESPFACKEALKEVWKAFGEEQAKRDVMLEDAAKGQRHMWIQHLMIRPLHQRQGIGHALLARALLRADAAWLPAVIVSSAESVGLYGRVGFVSLGSFRLDNGRWAREAVRVLAESKGREEEEEEEEGDEMLVERYDGVFEVEDVMVRAAVVGGEVEQV